MKPIIARCGIRCDLCPAFHINLAGRQDKENMSRAFALFYDYHLKPEEIKPCQGCLFMEKPNDPQCSVFPCTREKGIPNCAHCDDFPCDKITAQMEAFEQCMSKHKDIPPADYEKYCKPFDNRQTLQKIRNSRRA